MEEKIARLKAELREILDRYSKNPAAEDGERAIEDGMTAEREARILEGAISKWTWEVQSVIAIEEMAELTKAIIKYHRVVFGLGQEPANAEPFREAIREELADVIIMTKQLEIIFGEVSDIEIQKLERLERRLQE